MSVVAQPLPGSLPFGDLARFGDRAALITSDGQVTYADLAARVAARAAAWQGDRRLVVLQGSNSVAFVEAYLAALAAGCPVVLLPPGEERLAAVADTFRPGVLVNAEREVVVSEAGAGDGAGLHPDLALLLSTSGSTGSAKLVRLSRENLRSNAESIATYLGLTPADRGITSLPLHYCYGLSILHSHLSVGAGIVLTDSSVVDDDFWRVFEAAGVTGLSGVPHTFDLLDHCGFSARDLPTLRYVTQAGGRLEPDRVLDLARLGRRRGWDFYVMYGQTEATARMAYLPPDLVEDHPGAIGHPVPGGSLRIDPVADAEDGVGELVYEGPNVMMGYASTPADLALEPMPPELRTGDLARALPGGLYEVVGRRSRFTKVFGLRINLDDVERHLAQHGIEARCVGLEGSIDLFLTRRQDVARARALVAELCDVPGWVVHGRVLRRFPRTASGKADYGRLAELAGQQRPGSDRVAGASPDRVDAEELRRLYARVLDRPDARIDDSFADLGADSLSYVEMAVRMGERIDPLPPDWHRRSIRELAESGRRRQRWGTTLDSTVALRAAAIVFIVGSHVELFTLTGGAHLLLMLAGYNFARFHLGHGGADPTHRRIAWAVTAIALPSVLWIAAVLVVTGDYDVGTALFLNWQLGAEHWDDRWRFWFLEALVWTLVGLALLFSFRRVRALERRYPLRFALGALAVALGVRYVEVGQTAEDISRYTILVVLWCFALGWVAARARTLPARLLTSVVAVVTIMDFFGEADRERLVLLGLLFALWVPALRVPRLLAPVLGVLATCSLAVYLTHWQIYPYLEVDHQFLALLASLALGIGYHYASKPLVDAARRRFDA